MKFRIKRNPHNLLYVQVKEGWFFWKTIRKDGEDVLVNSVDEANALAKQYFIFVKSKQKKDDVLRSFVIK